MRKKKIWIILLILFLIGLLVLVIGSRTAESGEVKIDGGERPVDKSDTVLTSEKPTDPDESKNTLSDLPDIDITSWEYVLANNVNEYTETPQVSQIGYTGFYFDSRALEDLTNMIADCKAAGNTIAINQAYVPYAAEETYFNNKLNELAKDGEDPEDYENTAIRYIPKAGYSDHQTGLGIDFADDYYGPYSQDATLNYNAQQWLIDNCADYGFIQRYPKGKAGVTGYTQPYHYRYVGKEAANYMKKNDLTLEEFIALYK